MIINISMFFYDFAFHCKFRLICRNKTFLFPVKINTQKEFINDQLALIITFHVQVS